jgi:peptidoglycan/LPS O-acetylase OafA/YrhL
MSNPSQPYLTTLTPLRGIAALLVVVFHSNMFLIPFAPALSSHFIENGWLWVDFFFVLSGFIIAYVYGANFRGAVSGTNYKKYIGARFARVYPLHLFTLVWAALCAWYIRSKATGDIDPVINVVLNLKAVPASLLMMQGMHLYFTPPLNTPSWSLSTEWWMYMIFPFIMPFFARVKMRGRVLILLMITGYYIALKYWIGPIAFSIQPGKPTINLVSDFGFLRCMAGFMLGMLLYEFYAARFGYDLLKKSWAFVLFFAGALIAMHAGIPDLLIIAFFPLILITAAYNTTTVKRVLEWRALQRLGDWSYSIYMVHIPLVYLFYVYNIRLHPDMLSPAAHNTAMAAPPNYAAGAVLCIILVIATILVAALTYRFVEVPARNYLNKLFHSRRPKISAAAMEV